MNVDKNDQVHANNCDNHTKIRSTVKSHLIILIMFIVALSIKKHVIY